MDTASVVVPNDMITKRGVRRGVYRIRFVSRSNTDTLDEPVRYVAGTVWNDYGFLYVNWHVQDFCQANVTPSWLTDRYDGLVTVHDKIYTCYKEDIWTARVTLDLEEFDRAYFRRVAIFWFLTEIPAELIGLVFSFLVPDSSRFIYHRK